MSQSTLRVRAAITKHAPILVRAQPRICSRKIATTLFASMNRRDPVSYGRFLEQAVPRYSLMHFSARRFSRE
jgi:hypothetical protein